MKKKPSYFFLFILGFFTQITVFSQTTINGKSDVLKLSFQDCINRAKTNNFQKKQAQTLSKIKQTNLLIAQNERLPKISGNMVNYLNSGRSIDRYTNLFTEETIANQSYGIGAEIPIYMGGQIQNNILIKEIEAKLTENDIANIDQNLSIEVLKTFLGVLNAEEQLIIAKQQIEVSTNQLNKLESLSKEGLSSRMNILEFKVQVVNDELQIINAENELSLSKIKLLQVMNETNVGDFQIDRKSIETSLIQIYKTPINAIINFAISNHPSIKSTKALAEISRLNFSSTKATLLPTVGLGVSFGSNYSSAAPKERFVNDGKNKLIETTTNDYILLNNNRINLITTNKVPTGYIKNVGYFDQLGQNFNKILYLNFSIPIYDGGITKKRIENAQLSQKIANIQISESEYKLKQTIELAYKEMLSSFKRLSAINKQSVIIEELFGISKKQLEEGVINATDYVILKSQFDKIK
uniref:TolC family protein n=1 Tax=Emticicia sp. TaxID=1930953 RepID=UPI003750C803